MELKALVGNYKQVEGSLSHSFYPVSYVQTHTILPTNGFLLVEVLLIPAYILRRFALKEISAVSLRGGIRIE